MFNKKDYVKNSCQLTGSYGEDGFERYFHTFTGYDKDTDEEKVFYVEYIIVNPLMGWDEVKRGKNQIPSYTLVRCGVYKGVSFDRYIPMSKVDSYTIDGSMRLVADDCFLSENSISGHAGDMSWNIRVRKTKAYNAGRINGPLVRKMKAFDTFWHVQGLVCKCKGLVKYKDREYLVSFDRSYGYSDKSWGDEFPKSCFWLYGNRLYSRMAKKELEDSAFAFAGLRPVFFGKNTADTIVGGLYYEGAEFEYNFSKPELLSKSEYKIDNTQSAINATVVLQNSTTVLAIKVYSEKQDMVNADYEDTLGENPYEFMYETGIAKARIRLYTKFKGALVLMDDIDVINAGFGYGEQCL